LRALVSSPAPDWSVRRKIEYIEWARKVVRGQNVAQVSLVEYDDMIEAFPSDRADQSFSMPVLPWRSWLGWSVTIAHRSKPPFEWVAIDAIAIADDVTRRRAPAATLGELPSNPVRSRVRRRSQPQDLTSAVP
jgi:hypothetical protein